MESTRIVECDACGAGHELERILIGPDGTPVRCAACGHVFTVTPEDERQMRSPVVWIVRDPAGNTTPFRKLGVLQKMILEGAVSPDWQLSRFGESWRPLRAIAGLKPFFARAEPNAG